MIVEFIWDKNELGEKWFNEDNLANLIYSSTKVSDKSLKFIELNKPKSMTIPKLEVEIIPNDCDYIPTNDEGFCVRHDGVNMHGKLYLWEKIEKVTILPTGEFN